MIHGLPFSASSVQRLPHLLGLPSLSQLLRFQVQQVVEDRIVQAERQLLAKVQDIEQKFATECEANTLLLILSCIKRNHISKNLSLL